MKRNANSEHKGVRWIKADAHSSPGTVTGVANDCQGMGELLAVLSVDDVGTPAGSITVKFQESATGVTSPDSFDDITGATFGAQVLAGLFVGRIDLEKRKRYIRSVATIATGPVDAACLGTLSPNRTKPVTQTVTTVFDV